MQFSSRTGWQAGLNPWAEAVEHARSQQQRLLDLTVSNPTACGLGPTTGDWLEPLCSPEALHYDPEPFGTPSAREAVAAYYRDHRAAVPVEDICLTTSTSEAYSFLFRLLCDVGDEVLIARPSYPLFDLLATVQDVTLREYPLFYEPGMTGEERGAWSVDLCSLEAQITPRTRALIVVHPNNPTGHYVSGPERQKLVELCRDRSLALLVDEVFLDYPLGAGRPASFAGETGCLCFVLSGLSKVCALPQMKLSWIATSGPRPLVQEAMRRLEIIADTFLSVNAPMQVALPEWLGRRSAVQEALLCRVRENLLSLDTRLRGSLGDRLALEGGWTAVLRVPRSFGDTPFAIAALQAGVMVQPGEFYGLPEGRCVLSLLIKPDKFREGLRRLPL